MPVPVPVPGSANSSSSSSSGSNIWEAAGEGDLERVKYWVEQRGLGVTVPDQFTYTPIHAAASWAREEVLRYLLSHPTAPTNAANILDSDGDSPLFVTEQLSIAKILLEEFHADPKLVNKEGHLPQDAARENEQEELARYLSELSGVPLANVTEEEDEEEEGGAAGGEHAEDDDDEDDALASQRADEMMTRVEALMRRAQARQEQQDPNSIQQDTPIELTDAEEEELRRLVGEGVVRQLLEGWQRGVMQEGDRGA